MSPGASFAIGGAAKADAASATVSMLDVVIPAMIARIVAPRCSSSGTPYYAKWPLMPVRRKNISSGLAVIDAVRPHVGRGCNAIRHVEEAGDGGDVPDVALGKAGAA